jgi:hypothetical protein
VSPAAVNGRPMSAQTRITTSVTSHALGDGPSIDVERTEKGNTMPDIEPDLGRCRSRDPRLGAHAAEVAQCWETALNRLKAILEANAARELAANAATPSALLNNVRPERLDDRLTRIVPQRIMLTGPRPRSASGDRPPVRLGRTARGEDTRPVRGLI